MIEACFAQGPSTFIFSDHNYLMMKPLVSSCFCSHDLRVNNLAQGAQTVVHQKNRCFQSEKGGHMVSRIYIFIWSSKHLLTRSSSCFPTIPSSACPCLLLSGISESCWCWLGSKTSRVDHHHGEASEESQSMAWRQRAPKGEIFTDDYSHLSTLLCWVTNMQPSILLQDSDSLMSTLIAGV